MKLSKAISVKHPGIFRMERRVAPAANPAYVFGGARTNGFPAIHRTANRVVANIASCVAPGVDTISRREERELTAQIEQWILARAIVSITFSFPEQYPASKPCPERVVIKGDGWRAVYLEKGMKLAGN